MHDTAGNYTPFIDMCPYCELDTGGGHKVNCPLFQPLNSPIVAEIKIKITITYEEEK